MFDSFFSGLMDPSFASTAANSMDPSALMSQLGLGASFLPQDVPLTGQGLTGYGYPTGSVGASNMDNPWFFLNPTEMGKQLVPEKPVAKLNLTPQDLMALQAMQQKPADPKMAPAVSPPAAGKGGAFSPYTAGQPINPNALSLGKLINGR